MLDLDQLPVQCFRLLDTKTLLDYTEPLPLLEGFSREAESTLEELQEVAFAILSSFLYNQSPLANQSFLHSETVSLVSTIERFFRVAGDYKAD